MTHTLTLDEQLQILRFVCAFAWANLEISQQERDFVAQLVARFALPEREAEEVMAWLDHPPAEIDLDPLDISPSMRDKVLDAVVGLLQADGDVDTMEVENFSLFQALIGEIA